MTISEDPQSYIIGYDKLIWTVFSIGVVSSVIILYYFYTANLGYILSLLALILGFAILIYSFLLVRGYNHKKSKIIKIVKDHYFFSLSEKLRRELEGPYPRTRWMGESILILIGIVYLYSFTKLGELYILIPIVITTIFAIMDLYANLYS